MGRCKFHGGASPQAEAAGRARIVQESAREAMTAYGLPVHVDPAQALLEEISRTAGHVVWLQQQIERVGGERPDALVAGTRKVRQTRGPDGNVTVTEVGPGVHVWLQLYQSERRHLVRVCAAALSAGVEERRVRLAEQQGSLLASVIRAVLDDMGLTAEQRARIPEVVPRHLRAVSG